MSGRVRVLLVGPWSEVVTGGPRSGPSRRSEAARRVLALETKAGEPTEQPLTLAEWMALRNRRLRRAGLLPAHVRVVAEVRR